MIPDPAKAAQAAATIAAAMRRRAEAQARLADGFSEVVEDAIDQRHDAARAMREDEPLDGGAIQP